MNPLSTSASRKKKRIAHAVADLAERGVAPALARTRRAVTAALGLAACALVLALVALVVAVVS